MASFSVNSSTRRVILSHTTPTRDQLARRVHRRLQFQMLAPYLLGLLAFLLLGVLWASRTDTVSRTLLITLGLGCLIGVVAYAVAYGWQTLRHPDFQQACLDEMDRHLALSPLSQDHIAQACALDPAVAGHVQALRVQGRILDNALAEKCRRHVQSWEVYATQ